MQSFVCGLSCWRKATKYFNGHYISKIHIAQIHTYISRRRLKGTTDCQLALHFENDWLYWRLVLRPALATVKLLTSLGLAFRDTTTLQLKMLGV
jgi:hypothetical protein